MAEAEPLQLHPLYRAMPWLGQTREAVRRPRSPAVVLGRPGRREPWGSTAASGHSADLPPVGWHHGGHVFSSFLALAAVDELKHRLGAPGSGPGQADIRDLEGLGEVEVHEGEHRHLLRTQLRRLTDETGPRAIIRTLQIQALAFATRWQCFAASVRSRTTVPF